MLRVFAPAKVNLTLHVTGQREDGYHLLDSLVAFPDIGDVLEITELPRTGETSLRVVGKDAGKIPSDSTNLILKAHQLFFPDRRTAITLNKTLPVASGIGGGSADAAALLNALKDDDTDFTDVSRNMGMLLSLGADVPACVQSRPLRMRGIGEVLDIIPDWPGNIHIVLVNPGVQVRTPAAFEALTHKQNPTMPSDLPKFADAETLIYFVAKHRNDLQGPAIDQHRIIADVIDALKQTSGCGTARMSGSGATCFGLYGDASCAAEALQKIERDYPMWWAAKGRLGAGSPTTKC